MLCLVCVFKQSFSVFKQHFTYFNTLFHPHVFLQIFLNNNFHFLNTYQTGSYTFIVSAHNTTYFTIYWCITLRNPFFFFGVWYQITKASHLMVISSHWTILISHITVLLSYLMVSLFFKSHSYQIPFQKPIILIFGVFSNN